MFGFLLYTNWCNFLHVFHPFGELHWEDSQLAPVGEFMRLTFTLICNNAGVSNKSQEIDQDSAMEALPGFYMHHTYNMMCRKAGKNYHWGWVTILIFFFGGIL